MGKRQISITIDSELLGVIDQIANITQHSRSEIIEYCIRYTLKQYKEYMNKISINRKKTYDIIDRIIDEAIRKAFGEQE